MWSEGFYIFKDHEVNKERYVIKLCVAHIVLYRKHWQTLDLEHLRKTRQDLTSITVSGKKISNILYVVWHPFYKGKSD